MDNKIHRFNDTNAVIYLTKEEHNMFAQDGDSNIAEVDSEQYQRGYQNAIDDFKNKLKLRSREAQSKSTFY